MSGEQEQDDRAWAADKRDFVAARRDDLAAERDTAAAGRDLTADEREHLADEREDELDEQERRNQERAAELGLPPGGSAGKQRAAAVERAAAAAQRQLAREERDQRRGERGVATGAREAAEKLRQADTPATGLAAAFAALARYLYEADNFEDVLTRIVQTTVSAVADCDMASITVREGGKSFRTLASTHAAALAVDEAQYEAREGPCLDAVDRAIVHAPSFPDPRWPRLAERPGGSGVGAIVSYRLAAPGRVAEDPVAGSLNAYAGTPQAFGDEAQEIGLILAAHASIGIQAVREREAFELAGRQLHQALSSRDVIGQAKGILMERLRITPEEAFDTLRRSSQRLNLKLREIAQQLAETGQIDGPGGN
jgi:GAF domain-containing protein